MLAFKAVGKVESADCEHVLRPFHRRRDCRARKGTRRRRARPEFDGYSAGAAWEDVKLIGPALTNWERCAVVTDHRLIADAIKAFGMVMPGEFKVFPVSELEAALAWAAG